MTTGEKPELTIQSNIWQSFADGLWRISTSKNTPFNGFAKVSMETKEKWGKMIESYLHTSKPLKGVFLLVDIRHKPSANDCQMFDWMVNSGFSPVVIATKLDKIKRSQLSARVKEIRTTLGMKSSEVLIPFSAETKQGREEIWAYIDSKNKEEE